MKAAVLFLATFFGITAFSYIYQTNDRLEKLAAENRELRLRGAARERVQKFFTKGLADTDAEGLTWASYNLGTPIQFLTAVRQHENGSPLWEMGHRGKTEWIALNAPPNAWQYAEAARTLNKALWKWALTDEKRKHQVISALAKEYTAAHNAKKWSNDVEQLTGIVSEQP